MDYASKGTSYAGLATGIIGTSLSVIDAIGGIASRHTGGSDDDPYVTRYELGLIQANTAKDMEISMLRSQLYTDNQISGVNAVLAQQNTFNGGVNALLSGLQGQVTQLFGMTELGIPARSVVGPMFAATATATNAVTTQTTTS